MANEYRDQLLQFNSDGEIGLPFNVQLYPEP